MIIDTNIFHFFHSLAGKSGFIDGLTVFFASYLQYVLGALFLVFLAIKTFPVSKGRVFWSGIVSIVVARGIVTTIIRYFYHRPRPFVVYNFTPLIPENDYSFPSGHMTFFFALSMVVFMYNKKWGAWFMICSALMGIARIIAGVHWPFDILGGAITGIVVGYLTVKLVGHGKRTTI
jgi:undecaprenyl-diphosphatase